jgi:hypothetical protein
LPITAERWWFSIQIQMTCWYVVGGVVAQPHGAASVGRGAVDAVVAPGCDPIAIVVVAVAAVVDVVVVAAPTAGACPHDTAAAASARTIDVRAIPAPLLRTPKLWQSALLREVRASVSRRRLNPP